MNIYNCLPASLKTLVSNLQGINELRLRAGQPIVAIVKGEAGFLTDKGFLQYNSQNILQSNSTPDRNNNKLIRQEVITISQQALDNILFCACEQSIYAYEEQISNGYIALENGVRLGLCGETTFFDGEIRGYKKITSLNVRFANHIDCCSKKVMPFVVKPLRNTLVISPPFCGKTTLLRDMTLQIAGSGINILIADERAEITMGGNFYILGCDVMLNCGKNAAILQGIRSLSPQLIVTDEVFASDVESISLATQSGVCFFASLHAENLQQAKGRLGEKLFCLFERFIVLSNRNGVGTIEGVFDEKGNILFEAKE